uniref:Uncharacterized protein n=1 Tax=Glossina austeni TaxID=7395 RepID=A0A1A9VFW6_GLOAU
MRNCNNNVKLCVCATISIGSHSLQEYEHEFVFIIPKAFLCDNKADQWQYLWMTTKKEIEVFHQIHRDLKFLSGREQNGIIRWASTCACVRRPISQIFEGRQFSPSACIASFLHMPGVGENAILLCLKCSAYGFYD